MSGPVAGPRLPRAMRAVVAAEPGGPEVLRVVEQPVPNPGPGEVLVRVRAAGVNRADVMQRRGDYAPPDGRPVLGLEVSGTVVAHGEGTAEPSIGSSVVALVGSGGYAEYVAVPHGQVAPAPAGIDRVDAAGVIEVAATVWSNVFMLARLSPGERILVHGGVSGIGTMAVQLALHHGARVATTVGSAHKADLARELGAELVVDYTTQDFAAAVAAAEFVPDVILDVVGGPYVRPNVRLLATKGRLVVIGLQGGLDGDLPIGELLYKQGSVLATSLRARPDDDKAAIVRATVSGVWPALESGAVRPIISGRRPLEQVADAHRALDAAEHVGKEVLIVADA